MKTSTKNFSKVLLMAITILTMSIISSCNKDGEAGPAGTNGSNGINGTNGIDGNVNIRTTPWSTRTFTGSGSNWQITFAMPQITQIEVDSGLLLTYRKGAAGEAIQVFNSTTPYFIIYYYSGNISMESSSNQSGMYRHIILPPFFPAGTRGVSKPDYSKMSYHEICTKFNIPE